MEFGGDLPAQLVRAPAPAPCSPASAPTTTTLQLSAQRQKFTPFPCHARTAQDTAVGRLACRAVFTGRQYAMYVLITYTWHIPSNTRLTQETLNCTLDQARCLTYKEREGVDLGY